LNTTTPDLPTPRKPALMTRGSDVWSAVIQARSARQRIGLVPTMGALHEGHLSLVREAKSQCDFAVVTIFVNPTQFGPREDLDQYPRTLTADLGALACCDVDAVFVPTPDEIYPAGFSTYVEPPRVSEPLEGRCRPGHFRGVATVVLKLFNLVPADVAFFGQKDYQQFLVIQRMVEDLNVPIEIRMCPIIREPDGLAMSSRNRYLSDSQRQCAVALSRALGRAQELVAAGERDAPNLIDTMQRILAEAGVSRVDYVAITDPQTLEPLARLDRQGVALIAAYVGQTRLIDNALLRL
jgi:pantoate--beta-alanine ligase